MNEAEELDRELLAEEPTGEESGSTWLGVFFEVVLFVSAYLVLSGLVAVLVAPNAATELLSGQELLNIQVLSILGTFPLVYAFLGYRGEGWHELGLTIRGGWFQTVGLGLALGVIIKFLTIPLAALLLLMGVEGKPLDLEWGEPGSELSLILGASLAGIHEELVFRGFLRSRVARLVGDPVAGGGMLRTGLPISAVFGLLHFTQGLGGVVVVTVAGIGFFAIAMHRQLSLVHAMLAHVAFNALAVCIFLALA